MRILITYAFCLTSMILTSQNLLLNGDFEDYSSCPNTPSFPPQAPNYEITKCIGWTCPTYGTSDYFNVCSASPFVSIPNNLGGYQQAYSGDGYVGGFFTSYTGGSGTDGYSGIMWWEYIQGQFVAPLEKDKIYKISLFVNVAEYSDLVIKEFGAYLSSNKISSPNTANLNVTPQIKFINNSYFTDTVNWVQVEGTYLANGGEKYITIGNFNDNNITDTLRRYYSTFIVMPFVTYMYIDAAETIDITDTQPIPNVFTPNGDGINDLWKLPLGLNNYEVIIYNRWGNEIIKASALNFAWDGKTKHNEMCNDGNYFYVIKNIQNNTNSIKGFLQLNQ